MLRGDLRAAVLEVPAVEVLMVVAQRQPIGRIQLVVGLDEEHVLVLRLIPALRQRLQPGQAGDRVGVGRRVRGNVEKDQVGQRVPLRVGVHEDEIAIAPDRSAKQAAELVVVIDRLRRGPAAC